jgi:hypothetical protein
MVYCGYGRKILGFDLQVEDDEEAILETQRLIHAAMGGWPISRRHA